MLVTIVMVYINNTAESSNYNLNKDERSEIRHTIFHICNSVIPDFTEFNEPNNPEEDDEAYLAARYVLKWHNLRRGAI